MFSTFQGASGGGASASLMERPLLLFITLLSGSLVLAGLYSIPFALTSAPDTQASAAIGSGIKKNTVLLELFVMSRCPDAHFCEDTLDVVLKQHNMHNIVTVKMNYIADINATEYNPWSPNVPLVTCKHGTLECEGNKQQLCVSRYTHRSENARMWSFVRCQDALFSAIGTQQLFHDCMDSLRYDNFTASAIELCAATPEGDGLLAASAQLSKKRGVKTSCTIHVNGVPRCVRDGNNWYNCTAGSEVQDFVNTLCGEYYGAYKIWPPECGAQVSPPPRPPKSGGR